jgi:hypothetical protein
MKLRRSLVIPAIVALAVVAAAPIARAATFTLPVVGWEVHNGTSTVSDGGTDSPTYTGGDNITAMGTFPEIELLNDGDYLTFTTTLTMANRSGAVGANTLNTQLRVGLFDGPDGPIVANDVANVGLIIEYTNQPAGGLIREQSSLVQTAPFVGPSNIGNGSADADSISGVNPPPVLFTLTLTRNGGEIDLTGQISGGSHLANYSVLGHSSATFPANGAFTFNRVGLFVGDNVNAATASLVDATITTNVPEPGAGILLAFVAMGSIIAGRRAPRGARAEAEFMAA